MRAGSMLSALFCLAAPIGSQALAQTAGTLDCWRAEEVAASRIQNLQSLLMVQALKCQDTLPSATDSYNRFVEAKRPLLITSRRTVIAHFVRLHGPASGPAALTDYETRLSNHSSSPTISVAQCEQAGAFARMAMNADDRDLPMLAETLATNTVIRDCAAPASARAAMVMPSWPRTIPSRAPVPPAGIAEGPAYPYPYEEEEQQAEAPPLPMPLPPTETAAAYEDTAPAYEGVETAAVAPMRQRRVPAPAAEAPSAPDPTADRAETVAALRAAVAALNRVAGKLEPAGAPGGYDPQQ